jgi:hypothetical protein
MIINHTKKYIYIRNPKTGSTSLQSFLIENNEDDIQHSAVQLTDTDSNIQGYSFHPHTTIKHIVDSKLMSKEDVLAYDKYVIVRNPVDRFISASYHYATSPLCEHIKINNVLDKNEVVRKVLKDDKKFRLAPLIFMPQKNWAMYNGIKLNKIFKYEDINSMATELIGKDCTIPYNYRSDTRKDNKEESLSAELVERIEFLYKDDVALYNE